MRKFKLKTDYPDSGKKVGDTIEFCGSCTEILLETNDGYSNFYYTLANCEKFDNWEEIMERNYQVLAFQCNDKDSISYGKYSVLVGEDTYAWEDNVDGFACNIDDMLESVRKGYNKIYKVKRLSDGKVFMIGDMMARHKSWEEGTPCYITLFLLKSDDTIKVCIDQNGSKGTYPFDNNMYTYKKCIFITEDKVEMFEGDTYYYTNSHYVNPIKEEVVRDKKFYSRTSEVLRFSTEFAAQDYIVMNSPSLSVNDVMKAGYGIVNSVAL